MNNSILDNNPYFFDGDISDLFDSRFPRDFFEVLELVAKEREAEEAREFEAKLAEFEAIWGNADREFDDQLAEFEAEVEKLNLEVND